MIRSMTGFGRAVLRYPGGTVTAEIKSVNGKSLDLSTRLPSQHRDKEQQLRTGLGKILERGRVDLSVSVERKEQFAARVINHKLVRSYYRDLLSLAQGLKADSGDLFRLALGMPDAVRQEQPEADVKEWRAVERAALDAASALDRFRVREGKSIEHHLKAGVSEILSLLAGVEKEEPDRIARFRARIEEHLGEYIQKNQVDRNRLEQEMIYYIEKIDITEEKNRLRHHCEYFLQTIKDPSDNGRKLGFIAQEMGREINTLGSKASSASIQRLVVQMKDILEQIKEQLLNVL